MISIKATADPLKANIAEAVKRLASVTPERVYGGPAHSRLDSRLKRAETTDLEYGFINATTLGKAVEQP
jgi:hypothetical protein